MGGVTLYSLLLVMCFLFTQCEDNNDSEDDISHIELDQLNLPILAAATNNFAKDNKLGEGGFGEVFKVHFLPVSFLCFLGTPSFLISSPSLLLCAG